MEITLLSPDVLKVHPRNQEFFDDISGKDYEQFKDSIKNEGILTDIIVAPDMTVLSGHQRLKAAKELGLSLVPVKIRSDVADENQKMRILLAANFGRIKNDQRKQDKIAAEYTALSGYKNGDNQWGCQHGAPSEKLTLDEIAAQLGTTKRSLQRSLTIERKLTEEMKQLLDDGVFSRTIAADIISALSYDEQYQLISELDATQKYTAKMIEDYVNQIKGKDSEITKRDLQIKTLRGDLATAQANSATNNNEETLTAEIRELRTAIATKDNYISQLEKDVSTFHDAAYLERSKTDVYRMADGTDELYDLMREVKDLLENKLAPLKFRRCFERVPQSETARDNVRELLTKVQDWCDEIAPLITPVDETIIDEQIIY